MQEGSYIDKKGYVRDRYGQLVHRQVAYQQIYRRHREKYNLRFREYDIHHKDENKRNNHVSNLKIVTRAEHDKIHGKSYKHPNKEDDHKGMLHSIYKYAKEDGIWPTFTLLMGYYLERFKKYVLSFRLRHFAFLAVVFYLYRKFPLPIEILDLFLFTEFFVPNFLTYPMWFTHSLVTHTMTYAASNILVAYVVWLYIYYKILKEVLMYVMELW